MMEMTLSHVTHVAPYDHLMNTPSYLGLIKMFLEYLKGLVNAKVTK